MKKTITIWGIILAVAVIVNAWLIAFYAPVESDQGVAQKIFYWHVPSAMTMMIFFVLGGVASSAYMMKRTAWYDRIAISFIEVGFLFCTIVLVTGPLWAKPVWGAWWTWEPRLTSTLLVWLVFLGYFLLRASIENKETARLYGAVLALFGCLDIPIIMLAVKLWRGIHPQILAKRESLPDAMWVTLFSSFFTVFLLAAFLVCVRYHRRRESEG